MLPVDRYGLASEQALFTPQLIRNRQAPKLYAAFDAIAPKWPGHEHEGPLFIHHPPDLDTTCAIGGATTFTPPTIPIPTPTPTPTPTDPNLSDPGTKPGPDKAASVLPSTAPPPGPNSIVVSQDRWCHYPPSLGAPERQTNNPGAHLDICPWQYLPRTDRRHEPDTDIDNLRCVSFAVASTPLFRCPTPTAAVPVRGQ